MKKASMLLCGIVCLLGLGMGGEEPVDLQMVTRIKMEGLNNSQVMDTLSYLTDISGPRLTGSPGLKRASEWSRDKLQDWGLVKSKLEPWGIFGQGWSLEKLSVAMVKPYYQPMIAFPKAWSGGTDGVVRGKPVLVALTTEEDFAKYEGKLKGAIALIASNREAQTHFDADAVRRSQENLNEIAKAPIARRRGGFGRRGQQRQFRNKVSAFLKDQGVAVTVEGSRGEHGTLFVGSGGSRDPEDPIAIPSIVMGIEAHNQIQRILEKNIEVELEIEVKTQFHKEDQQAYNVVAEIPGTDPALRDELVMVGGHIDSWHSATGATDNAAGVSVAMEAVRILKALDVKPRRTIRIGLWSGEEQGLLGSRGYVEQHFAERASMQLKSDHEKFSGYFNLDNGTGQIRGVYLQGNDAVRPIFEAWLAPFADMGASTVTIRNTGGTDHLAFDAVGLPGFQFIQDQIDYNTRTHHTNMDFWDHVIAEDMKQASIIMASFVYHTAMRDEKLPRKPLPEPQPQRGRRGGSTAR